MEKQNYIIGIDDLVPNLIIELKLRNIKDYVTYDEIELYANNIRKQLLKENINLITDMNRNKTSRFFQIYKNYFEEIEQEAKIKLKNNISTEQLINEFRGYLPFNLLLAMINDDVIKNSIIYSDKEKIKINIK